LYYVKNIRERIYAFFLKNIEKKRKFTFGDVEMSEIFHIWCTNS